MSFWSLIISLDTLNSMGFSVFKVSQLFGLVSFCEIIVQDCSMYLNLTFPPIISKVKYPRPTDLLHHRFLL